MLSKGYSSSVQEGEGRRTGGRTVKDVLGAPGGVAQDHAGSDPMELGTVEL